MKDNWIICKIDDIVLDYLDFRGKTPLKLGMNWGGGNIRALSANNVEMGKVNFEKECYFGSDALYQKWMTKGDTEKGDVLLTMEAPLGNVAQVPDNSKYILSQRTLLFKFDSTKVDKTFMFYQLSGKDFQRQLSLNSTGSTVTGIQQKKLTKIKVSYPESLQKQKKIAKILSTCDEVIEKTEAAIAKYKAIKQGMMHDLFTRGIDITTGKLRPSYQEAPELYKESALGMIPKEWEVSTFGNYVIHNLYGPRFSSNDYHINGNVKTIRGTDFTKDGNIQYNQAPVAKLDKNKISPHILKNGDIVMITTADCGLTAVFEEQEIDFIPSAYAVKYKFNEYINPYFIKYLMQTESLIKQVNKFIRQGTLGNLPGSDVLKFIFCKPELEEQIEIVERLKSLYAKLQAEESALQKYKKIKEGLMQDLLTGRVEVSE